MLAQVVLAIAGEDFYKVLFDGLRAQLGACQLVVHRFRGSTPMIQPLAVEADRELAALDNTREYVNRLHAADPFRANLMPARIRTVCVHAVDAEQLENPEYRERLFLAEQLSGKLSLIVRGPEQALSLSIYRRIRQGPFSEGDVARVTAFGEVLSAALERHCTLQQKGLSELDELVLAFSSLPAEKPLSEREATVCAHIIRGDSNYAIAAELGLSIHSVSTYRRRAYGKLGVRSQSELFGLLLSHAQPNTPLLG